MGSGPRGTPRRVRLGYRCRIWCGGRLAVCALGPRRTPSLNENAPGDRWDRVAGRIESLIQQARTRSRGWDFDR